MGGVSSFRWRALCVLIMGQISWAQQLAPASNSVAAQAQVTANVGSTNAAIVPMAGAKGAASSSLSPPPPPITVANSTTLNDELKRFEEYKRSPIFVEPFDAKVLSMPEAQLAFMRDVTKKDVVFFKEILNEAISKRNKMAPSVRLVLKYSGRLLGNFIRNRREEKKLPNRIEPKADFFNMVADLCQQVLDKSGQLKHNYSKSKIDVDNFRSRVETLFDYASQLIDTAPMGNYLRWNQLVLYKDQPRNGLQNRHILDEGADLFAQFRVMGYESTSFVFRRIINLLRMFARGVEPSSESEV